MLRATLETLIAARKAGRAVVLSTPLDGGEQQVHEASRLTHVDPVLASALRTALATDKAQLVALAQGETLLTPFNPPLRLIIIGAVHIAESLCTMARLCGYRVTLIDPRSAFLRAALFPEVALIGAWPQQAVPALKPDSRTAMVLLTHDPKIDDPALLAVLRTDAFYIGALGSTRTHVKRLARLAEAGLSDEQLARVKGPAGLAIAARTPAEIAVSVLAQLTAALRGALP